MGLICEGEEGGVSEGGEKSRKQTEVETAVADILNAIKTRPLLSFYFRELIHKMAQPGANNHRYKTDLGA